MKIHKHAESLVGIIIGVFLLSIVILGITNLLGYSHSIINSYEHSNTITTLKMSTTNILLNIDTSQIPENELFYLYKDTATKTYGAFTGATDSDYKYIDKYGNHVPDIGTFQGAIYARQLWIEREDTSVGEQNQVIRASIRRLIKTSTQYN